MVTVTMVTVAAEPPGRAELRPGALIPSTPATVNS